MSRPYNFSAGPATLPEVVLEQVREEFLDWQGGGSSVLEVSHRGAAFQELAQAAERDLRTLLALPEDFAVLFLQGGARGQFAAVPMNLLGEAGTGAGTGTGSSADYLHSGYWAASAIKEARRYCEPHIIEACSQRGTLAGLVDLSDWQPSDDAAYVHYTANETIGGLQFVKAPHTGADPLTVPLVADMSSDFLTRSVDWSRLGAVYACAQKNLGPAGLTVVLVRRGLFGRARIETPSVLHYQLAAESASMQNTPPVFAWYFCAVMLRWMLEQGGLMALEQSSQRKSAKLYAALDQSDFYDNAVHPDSRSCTSVPFTLAATELEADFLSEATAAGLLNLNGHRSVGGLRACIYNGLPEKGVDALVDFMENFEQRRG